MFPVKIPVTNLEIDYEIPNFYNIFYAYHHDNEREKVAQQKY